MASDPKFSAWYFDFCQAHNRTPAQEEVWQGAIAANPAPAEEHPGEHVTRIEKLLWDHLRYDVNNCPAHELDAFIVAILALRSGASALPADGGAR